MGAFDISRNIFNPAKRYSSVRMQQGRVITDDDWNEQERIAQEGQQRYLSDIIGPFGSPDDGFKITNLVVQAGRIVDFSIHPGALYVGGLRLEMDKARLDDLSIATDTFNRQRDWLQKAPGSYLAPASLTGPRYDLVYLEAWDQGVSAVEDNELLEPALAGPDTSTRMRPIRRVKVEPNVGHPECPKAWGVFKDRLQQANGGNITHGMWSKVNTQLKVGFTEEGSGDDLCTPAVAGSYLGAENQAIRVQLVGTGHLTWGFDNAAPYYRIRMIDATTVEMIDHPRDQHHWPLASQNVEILAWSALLPNAEKVAEQAGHHSKLSGSYNPNTHRITLATPLPGGFNQAWQGRADENTIDHNNQDTHLYLRVWDRGTDILSTPLIAVGANPITLGNTGLTVTLTGTDRVSGDHWVIAARPESPSEVLPWRLQHEGMGPHGVRRFYAPLAIIRWQANPMGVVEGKIIHDCRKTFRPLTGIESCCTFHVGDGVRSFGDFNNLEEALANLPEEGGKLCVLPGTHRANLVMTHLKNITLHGCGDTSIILPKESHPNQPIISMDGCTNILIEGISFVARKGRAIFLSDTSAQKPSIRIRIRRNFILAVQNGIYLHAQSGVAGSNGFEVSHNEVSIPDVEKAGVGIFVLGDDCLIERNKVVVVPAPEEEPSNPSNDPSTPPGGVFDPCDQPEDDTLILLLEYFEFIYIYFYTLDPNAGVRTYLALGGIQIGGSSERVQVLENTVLGGASNGITLGHLLGGLELATPTAAVPKALAEALEQLNHLALTTAMIDLDKAGKEVALIYEKMWNNVLYDLLIERNHIRHMGLAGIGVAGFQVLYGEVGETVNLVGLLVRGNSIRQCAMQLPQEIRNSSFIGYGGIVLGEVEDGTLDDNAVRDCGLSHVEPICGIYIRGGGGIVISENSILNNGPEPALSFDGIGSPRPEVRRGTRGGIFIALAVKMAQVDPVKGELRIDGLPAVVIHDNIVVQPLGQALALVAMGPVSVEGNILTTQDLDLRHILSLIAGSVFILNLGISKDATALLASKSLKYMMAGGYTIGHQSKMSPELYLLLQFLPSGQVLFNDNQVTLDQRDADFDFSLSSCTILTLDDLSFVSNQLETLGLTVLLPWEGQQAPIPLDYALTDALLIGASIRTQGNRFQEGFSFSLLSLVSLAIWNTTMGNQSSHCMYTLGADANIFEHNIQGILDQYDCAQGSTQFRDEMKKQAKK